VKRLLFADIGWQNGALKMGRIGAVGLVIACALTSCSLSVSGVTAAQQKYIDDIRTAGISGADISDRGIVKDGIYYCNQLKRGFTFFDIEYAIQKQEEGNLTERDQVILPVDAVNDLCPKFKNELPHPEF